jgi:Flp pilus assembly protein TadB
VEASEAIQELEEQLPDAIDLFNRAMKAGHNIHAGLETIASERPEPTKAEYKKIVEELALGAAGRRSAQSWHASSVD